MQSRIEGKTKDKIYEIMVDEYITSEDEESDRHPVSLYKLGCEAYKKHDFDQAIVYFLKYLANRQAVTDESREDIIKQQRDALSQCKKKPLFTILNLLSLFDRTRAVNIRMKCVKDLAEIYKKRIEKLSNYLQREDDDEILVDRLTDQAITYFNLACAYHAKKEFELAKLSLLNAIEIWYAKHSIREISDASFSVLTDYHELLLDLSDILPNDKDLQISISRVGKSVEEIKSRVDKIYELVVDKGIEEGEESEHHPVSLYRLGCEAYQKYDFDQAITYFLQYLANRQQIIGRSREYIIKERKDNLSQFRQDSQSSLFIANLFENTFNKARARNDVRLQMISVRHLATNYQKRIGSFSHYFQDDDNEGLVYQLTDQETVYCHLAFAYHAKKEFKLAKLSLLNAIESWYEKYSICKTYPKDHHFYLDITPDVSLNTLTDYHGLLLDFSQILPYGSGLQESITRIRKVMEEVKCEMGELDKPSIKPAM